MDDLLLEQLCRICNVHPSKYTCPRCYFTTCSLPCARRHKIRAACSGERDPTVFKPINELHTPAGFDHDYNFIHSIESRVERSQNLIVEVKGLVEERELMKARTGKSGLTHKAEQKVPRGEESMRMALKKMHTTVLRAPKGMARSLENETRWNQSGRCINWHVEWLREGDAGRVMSEAAGNKPIGVVYAEVLKAENGKVSEPVQKRKLEGEPATHARNTRRKRTKQKMALLKQGVASAQFGKCLLQDEQSGAWCIDPSPVKEFLPTSAPIPEIEIPLPPTTKLFLLRPQTPSNLPKVLAPMDLSQPLSKILSGRTVLEYPTIYIFEGNMPSTGFLSEEEFLSPAYQKAIPTPFQAYDTKMKGTNDDEGSGTEDITNESEDSSEASSESEVEQVKVPKVWRSKRN